MLAPRGERAAGLSAGPDIAPARRPGSELPGGELAALASFRTAEVVEALGRLSGNELQAPSLLAGWSRLTIACHLRFGARTLLAMTADALAGRPASYYPGSRGRQRPGTLRPEVGESAGHVVRSLADAGRALDEVWPGLPDGAWVTTVHEPPDNPDLGPVSLGHLPLSRLTEVEVHGTDLGLGLADWSPRFVEVALAARFGRLDGRAAVPPAGPGPGRPDGAVSWLLVATDGPVHRVSVDAGRVTAAPAERDRSAAALVEGSSRDLLALLLGRPPAGELGYRGDESLGRAFGGWFPGP